LVANTSYAFDNGDIVNFNTLYEKGGRARTSFPTAF
jgi:hypothetical protein